MQSNTSKKSQSSLSKYAKQNRNPLSQQQQEQQQQSQEERPRKKREDESPKHKRLGIANVCRRGGKKRLPPRREKNQRFKETSIS
jgi:hypothetical protein